MIHLTKLNNDTFVLNSSHIETIQENPDTTIRLTNGNIYIVRETMEEVLRLDMRYRSNQFESMLRRDDF